MPRAALTPCLHHGCPTLVHGGRCDRHGGVRAPWKPSVGQRPRLSGRRLQEERARLFQREPLCRQCATEGRVSVATIRDHIVPWAEGGTDVRSNLQPLCRECSDKKTHEEARRGRARGGPAGLK